MAAEPKEFSLSSATDLFLIDYQKRSDNMYNSDNVLDGRIKKSYSFVGKQKNIETHLSFSGGQGSGKLPLAGTARYKQATIFAKKVYGRAQIEREAIQAASTDKGAFRRATQEVVRKCVEGYMRNGSRILFGDGTGILGKGDATGANISGNGSVGTPYVVTFPVGQWKEASWEEEDLVQVVTGLDASNQGGAAEGGITTTNLLLVVDVDPDTRAVSLTGTSAILAGDVGSALPADTGFCMQRSYLEEPEGLKGILTPYAGTTEQYGIPIQRRWSSHTLNANGEGITTGLMNTIMLKVEKKFSSCPNMIVTSFEQFQNCLDLLEDQKRYTLGNRNLEKGKTLKGQFSFTGVEFMSTRGAIGIFADRFCDEDRMYFLNDNFIHRYHRPGFGWFKEDGSVFMRVQDEDDYEARYGGYYQNFITPSAHGVIYGLAV